LSAARPLPDNSHISIPLIELLLQRPFGRDGSSTNAGWPLGTQVPARRCICGVPSGESSHHAAPRDVCTSRVSATLRLLLIALRDQSDVFWTHINTSIASSTGDETIFPRVSAGAESRRANRQSPIGLSKFCRTNKVTDPLHSTATSNSHDDAACCAESGGALSLTSHSE
jgi:hypothetical protein